MIFTGIFLFLLGTKLGQAATKTEVKYEGPDKITVSEQKDDKIVVPGLGSPPFAPSFFHQGSNFFFNPQLVLPGGIVPTGIETVIAPIQPPKEYNNIAIETSQMTSDIIVERDPIVEVIVPEPPSFEIEETIVDQSIPQFQVEIERLPIGNIDDPKLTLPPVQVLVEEPSEITIPCDDVQISNIIPGGAFSVEIPNVPLLIGEHFKPSGGLISEVDVRINKIPPPPELPPLIMTEIPKPVMVQENKRVIFVPSAPEFESFNPPPVMVAEKTVFPIDCAQNIIFERVLPNIAFENGKIVELISIPAAKRPPVVSSFIV